MVLSRNYIGLWAVVATRRLRTRIVRRWRIFVRRSSPGSNSWDSECAKASPRVTTCRSSQSKARACSSSQVNRIVASWPALSRLATYNQTRRAQTARITNRPCAGTFSHMLSPIQPSDAKAPLWIQIESHGHRATARSYEYFLCKYSSLHCSTVRMPSNFANRLADTWWSFGMVEKTNNLHLEALTDMDGCKKPILTSGMAYGVAASG